MTDAQIIRAIADSESKYEFYLTYLRDIADRIDGRPNQSQICKDFARFVLEDIAYPLDNVDLDKLMEEFDELKRRFDPE